MKLFYAFMRLKFVYRVWQTVGHIRYRLRNPSQKRFFPWWVEFTR